MRRPTWPLSHTESDLLVDYLLRSTVNQPSKWNLSPEIKKEWTVLIFRFENQSQLSQWLVIPITKKQGFHKFGFYRPLFSCRSLSVCFHRRMLLFVLLRSYTVTEGLSDISCEYIIMTPIFSCLPVKSILQTLLLQPFWVLSCLI